ncbi:MAG TPA: ATP-binding cassette domain-containing protein, partial [Kaistiaceae bacterium]|nr:ATP-binding cassette domain-containing protein [Kaistiaceae bacterium]
RRAALARVLAPEPDILLLDEPTNHLDLPAIEWLEDELKRGRSALVLISHDRRFLENLSRAVVWLDRGITRRLDRGFAAFEGWRDDVLAREEEERHKLDRKIVMEEDWLRYGVTARRKRNERRLRLLNEMRQSRRSERRAEGTVKMAASESEASGKLVIEAVGVMKSYDGRPIVAGFSTRIQRGDRVGIVGPNGAGKTTLIELLTGQRPPDAGTVKLGASVTSVSLDQRRESLDPAATVAETLTGGRGDTVMLPDGPKHVMSYMKDFLFEPAQARQPVSALSGGERGRLMLARALAKPANLIVLDEPTNDLDMETLGLLEEMLADYPGTVLVVSHDRDFLDRVVTSVVVSEGAGRWVEYAGGYSDMLAQRGADVAARAAATRQPKAKPAEEPAAERPQKEQKRRLTMKEMEALKTLPGRIDKLHAEIARLDAVLADADLYARDPARFEKAAKAHDKAAAELGQAEEEWLRIEILREELGL